MLNTIHYFLKQHIKSVITGFVFFIILVGALWAHIADHFERTVLFSLKSWQTENFVTFSKVGVNKFSLTICLSNPKILIPLKNDEVVSFVWTKNVYIRYHFLRRQAVVWTDGDTKISVNNKEHVRPSCVLKKDDLKNDIRISIHSRFFFPHFIPQDNVTDSNTGWGALSGIEIKAHNISLQFLNENQEPTNKASDRFFDFWHHIPLQSTLEGDYIHYFLHSIVVKKDHTNTYSIKFHDTYQEENLFLQLQNNMNAPLQKEGFTSCSGDVQFSFNKEPQKEQSKESGSLSLLDTLQNMILNVKRIGKFQENGYQQTYESALMLDPKIKTLQYTIKGTGQFINEKWKASLHPYLNLAVIWLNLKTDHKSSLDAQQMNAILPQLEEADTHIASFQWAIKYQDDGFKVKFKVGYEAKDHHLFCNTETDLSPQIIPYIVKGLLGTTTLAQPYFSLKPIKGQLTLYQKGRFLDHIENLVRNFQKEVQNPLLGRKIKQMRLFADYLIDRVAIHLPHHVVELPFTFDLETGTFDISNNKNYDDLIVKFLPELISPLKTCPYGHHCNGF